MCVGWELVKVLSKLRDSNTEIYSWSGWNLVVQLSFVSLNVAIRSTPLPNFFGLFPWPFSWNFKFQLLEKPWMSSHCEQRSVALSAWKFLHIWYDFSYFNFVFISISSSSLIILTKYLLSFVLPCLHNSLASFFFAVHKSKWHFLELFLTATYYQILCAN